MERAASSPLAEVKQGLGVDCLLLQIHDGSFPVDPAEDGGRGTPYSYAAERFFNFVAELGFDGVQLGPQGRTERGNPSPYDSTLFSRNPLNLPLGKMVDQGRLARATLRVLQAELPPFSIAAPQTLLDDICARVCQELVATASDTDRHAAREFLAREEAWLVPDALYGLLCEEHAAPWWRAWHHTPQGAFDQRLWAPRPWDRATAAARLAHLRKKYEQQIEEYAVIQWLLATEHEALRARVKKLGLVLYADLQVGLAPPDAWARQSLFLADYLLGAPPSRTNPAGQPWGYAVYDPQQWGSVAKPGPVLEFVAQRLQKVLRECDGVRIDHPHGWIDPWVYRADDPDPFHAVQHGARLFSTPHDPEHPALAAWSVARGDQLNLAELPYADGRVAELEEPQIEAYARLLDVIVTQLKERGCGSQALACEVLSTLPYPIACVLSRHGLGRFRVTQKLALDNGADVYRVEQAVEQDWIMLGTHDTPTAWSLATEWIATGTASRWGEYLADLLLPEGEREAWVREVSSSPGRLVQALFAAMLASRARHVSIFYPDLFGLTQRYNKPGIVDDENWRMRLSPQFAQEYAERVARGTALDLPHAAQLAQAAVSRRTSAATVGETTARLRSS
jgi:4-alpha-glucanotransferase